MRRHLSRRSIFSASERDCSDTLIECSRFSLGRSTESREGAAERARFSMRFRLIAFLPLAATAVALLLLTASSLVSAIDASLVPEPRMHAQPMRIQSFETEC